MFYLSSSVCPISLQCDGDLQFHTFPEKPTLDRKRFFTKPFMLTLTSPFNVPDQEK